MPGPSSIRCTWSRLTVELISACEPARSTMAISGAPDPVMVRWKPLAMAKNASSTTTTSATAITVDSDSHRRCEILFRLMAVTAATCKNSERMFSTSSERGGDLEPHGVERRNDAGDQAEAEHQQDTLQRNLG